MNCEFCNTVLDIDQQSRKIKYCSEICRRKIYLARKTRNDIITYIKNENNKLDNFSVGSLKKYGFVVSVSEKSMDNLVE